MDNERANKILIANIDIPQANEEVNWALPSNCKWFTLQTRDGTAIRLAIQAGKVANSQPPYFTLKADNAWDERYLDVNLRRGLPLYFACGTADKVVEAIMGVYDPETGGE